MSFTEVNTLPEEINLEVVATFDLEPIEVIEMEETEGRALETSNINLDVTEYLQQKKSDNTRKSDKQAVKMFNSIMARLRESDSPDANKFKSLHELDVDNMDFCLSKFFMCLVKQSGQLYNAASLITHYSALACRGRK